MERKVQILHLWSNEKDAQRLIRELSASGIDFEARLVRTHNEYVSALANKKFELIIADDRADSGSGPDDLSSFEIAREIAPSIPFLLVSDSQRTGAGAKDSKAALFLISQHELHRLGEMVIEILANH